MSLYQEVHYVGHEQEEYHEQWWGEDNTSADWYFFRGYREWLHDSWSMCAGEVHYTDIL